MNHHVIAVTGTDTDVGKTVFAAALTAALGATYWKPIQAGTQGGGDSAVARALGVKKILPEVYRLTTACSPDLAASIDGTEISPEQLNLPRMSGPLVIEGAGGVLVPITGELLLADLLARWKVPVVIVARTALGTINHSLLTIETLRSRDIPILGIAFNGDSQEHSEATIARLGHVRRLGRLPRMELLTATALSEAFFANFSVEDFR